MKANFGVIEFFGVVLVILGALNMMLTLRGGLTLDSFNYIFMGLGIIMITVGVIKRR